MLGQRILFKQARDPLRDGAHLRGGRLVTKAENVVEPETVAQREILQADIRDLSVGNCKHRPVERPEAGRTQSDVLHRAQRLAYL
jgi:hypothetical protein